jgi:hypothetical protein
VIPDDALLAEAYQAFHRSQQLREKFAELEAEFDEEATEIKVPKNLRKRIRAILDKRAGMRWDDAVQVALDKTQLEYVRAKKQKAAKKAGNFTAPPRERTP